LEQTSKNPSEKQSKIQKFSKAEELITAFEDQTVSGEPFILYLTAGPGKNGKTTWCPDCDAHLATIENKIINKNTNLPIL
jgi:thiol-disulfide isomerase/thioredoxin